MTENQSAKRYEAQCRLNVAISDGDLRGINLMRVALEAMPYNEDDDE